MIAKTTTDAWNADNVTEMDPAEERDFLAYLKPDERLLWEESKVTRRKNMATVLRRLAAARKALVCATI